ncbi:CHRD domain-containing protein [Aminobacter sp. SS-2016]|uniref:CHRD domain-containing protein n=1 Tax=Aminobacter sp. Y103A TaxID=1870862 RepID=UPI002572C0B3|nr:CHRD domain-containing protein [Aminobacter sp. SS-2016]
MKFKADLKAASEVPPTDSTGTGTADVCLDSATKKLSWTVTSTSLTVDISASLAAWSDGAFTRAASCAC